MQESNPFTAQTFIAAATDAMVSRTPHPVKNVEEIMRKIEHSPLLTENEKEILFSHIQDGSQYEAPLPLSIAKDDDGHFCIAIAGRKWKIMRHGIIGNGAADREDFHQAASDVSPVNMPVGERGIETTVPLGELDWLRETETAYKEAMKSRETINKSLGQIAYEGFMGRQVSDAEWHTLSDKHRWKNAGLSAYMSVGCRSGDTNQQLLTMAARARVDIMKQVGLGFMASDQIKVAECITAVAGPPPKSTDIWEIQAKNYQNITHPLAKTPHP